MDEPYQTGDSNLLQNDEQGIVYLSATEPILYPAEKWNIQPRLVEVGGSVQECDPNPYRALQMLHLIWNEDDELLKSADCPNSYGRLRSWNTWVVPLGSSAQSVDWELRAFCENLFLQTFSSFEEDMQKLVNENVDGFIEKVVLRKLGHIQRRLWEFRRHRKESSEVSNFLVSFSVYLNALKEITSGVLNKLGIFLCNPKGLKLVFKSSADGRSRPSSLFYLIHPKRVFHTLAHRRSRPEQDTCRKQIIIVNACTLRAALERPYYDHVRLVESIRGREGLSESTDVGFHCDLLRRDFEELALWEAERTKIYQEWASEVSASSTTTHDLDISGSQKISIDNLVSAAGKHCNRLAELHAQRRGYAERVVESADVKLKAILESRRKNSMLARWVASHFSYRKWVRREETFEQYNSRGELTGDEHSALTLEQVECLIYDSKIVQVLEDCLVDHWERLSEAAAGGVGGGNGDIKIEKCEPDARVWVYYKDEPISEENVYFGIRMCFDRDARLLLSERIGKEKSALFHLRTEGKTDFAGADELFNRHDRKLFDDTTRQSTSTSPSVIRDPSLSLKRADGTSVCIDGVKSDSCNSSISNIFVKNSSDIEVEICHTIRKKARTNDAKKLINVKTEVSGFPAIKLPSPLIPPPNNSLFGANRVELVKDCVRELIHLSDEDIYLPEMPEASSKLRSNLQQSPGEEIKGALPTGSSDPANPAFVPIAVLPLLVDLTGDNGDSNEAELSGSGDSNWLAPSGCPAKRPLESDKCQAPSGWPAKRPLESDKCQQQPNFTVDNDFGIQDFRTFDPGLRFPWQQFHHNNGGTAGDPISEHPPSNANNEVLFLHNNNTTPLQGDAYNFNGTNNRLFGCLPALERVMSHPTINATGFYEAVPPAGLPMVDSGIMNPFGPPLLTSGAQTNLEDGRWNRARGNDFVGGHFGQPLGYDFWSRCANFKKNCFCGNTSSNGGASRSVCLLLNFCHNTCTPGPSFGLENSGLNHV